MAKKTHIKIRMVPESKPDSPFFYYLKKPAEGENTKEKKIISQRTVVLFKASNEFKNFLNFENAK